MTKLNEYQKEYQQICKQTPRFTIGDCAGGHRGDNREKNRDVLVVPRMYYCTKTFDFIVCRILTDINELLTLKTIKETVFRLNIFITTLLQITT